MVPSEWSLVDLSESETTTLIWILDVGEVIVEVVESRVSTGGLVHLDSLVDGGHGIDIVMDLGVYM